MPRPKRTTAEAFYDVFSDMDFTEQEIALRICTEIHRQEKRQRRTIAEASDTLDLAEVRNSDQEDGK